MTIHVDVSPDNQQRLEDLASRHGKPVEAFVNELIERAVRAEEPIDTILAPFRQGFSESGMTDEQATSFLDSELHAVRANRRSKSRM